MNFSQIFVNDKEFDCPYLLPQRLSNISHVSVYPRYGDRDLQLHYAHVGEKYSVSSVLRNLENATILIYSETYLVHENFKTLVYTLKSYHSARPF